jgi:hypothetical protein
VDVGFEDAQQLVLPAFDEELERHHLLWIDHEGAAQRDGIDSAGIAVSVDPGVIAPKVDVYFLRWGIQVN